ncbi:MAG TPA: hypothetical protein VK929_08775 [Longimicrobiales bacterium]|nr:hypothetical protein [Longimicrobiales bacterium]
MRTVWQGAVIVTGVVLVPLLAGCEAAIEATDWDLGAAVADSVDTEWAPTMTVNAYRCDYRAEECRPGLGSPGIDATQVTGGFAARLGLPVVRLGDFQPPACPWVEEPSEGDADREHGFFAHFIRPPVILRDEARVQLITGCLERGAAFEVTHEFTLRRSVGGWIVIRRTTTSAT